MTINDFMNLTEFSQFKNQKKIKIENNDEINKFFKIIYNKNFKPFYHLNSLYNTILNNNQFQYIIIRFKDDEVMICYKIIQIMNTKQIRIIGSPISINYNSENINTIYSKLLKLSFIRIVTMNENKFNGETLCEYNDYYYDFSKRKFNGQFRSKHGINKMLNDSNFKIICTNRVEKSFIEELRNEWILGMNKNHSTVSNLSTKNFYKIIEYENDNNLNIIITYKNKPISIQNFIINEELKYADCLYINHLGRKETNDIELNKILKNITDIQNYFAFKELSKFGIYNIYIAGCRPTEKRLLNHKEKITDGVIKYYIK